ncbi:MAG: phosphoglycerate dehydrogenase [Phycisphaerales bacterium]
MTSERTTSFPKDKIEVVLLEGTHPSGTTLIENAGFDVRTHAGALEGEALTSAIARAHVVGVRSKTQLTSEVLSQCDRLLAVGCFCAGTNQVDLDVASSMGIPVFNSPFSNTRSVAELTISEIIALHRRLSHRSSLLHSGDWDKSAEGSHEVRGRTLGIVGYGHIGSQVSVLAESLGMRVVFFDADSKLPLGNANSAGSLEELLRIADVVTLHVPENESTMTLMNKERIGMMKPGAYLINNARGSVVDLQALRAAIDSGHIAGAALDVFPDEPAKRGHRFENVMQGAANVILTPHVGGSTMEAQEAISVDAAEKLVKFINRGTTTGAVNVPNVDLPSQVVDGQRSHRILDFHRNVPGVLGKFHEAASSLGVNISGQYLRTMGDIGYVVLDADPAGAAALKERMQEIEESITTRMLW